MADLSRKADWEASREAWAEEVRRRAGVIIPQWEEEGEEEIEEEEIEEEEIEEEAEARAQAAEDLPPPLLEVYLATADGPVAQPCDTWTYPDGSRWGVEGPVIRSVSEPHRCEFFISLSPDDSDCVRVSRAPSWLLYCYYDIPFDDPDLPWQVLALLDDRDPDSLERLDHTGDDDDDDV